jgi:hypothetical protein
MSSLMSSPTETLGVTVPETMLGKNHVVTSQIEMQYDMYSMTHNIHHMVKIDDRVFRDLPPNTAHQIKLFCETKAKELLQEMQSHIYDQISYYNHPRVK